MASFTLATLAEKIGAELRGPAERIITGLGTLEAANGQEVSFLSNPRYTPYLQSTQAGAVLLTEEAAKNFAGNALIVANPYLSFAHLTHLFDDPWPEPGQRHPSAIIHPDARLDPSVVVGPGAVIEADCHLAAGVVVSAQCFIGKECQLGENTLLHPRVTLYRRTRIGSNCILHSGAVIGADGFGFAPTGQGWEKIAQLGQVIIEDQVEIGANTSIDRGALGATRIGRNVKIDNHVMIGHNVQVGENTAMAAFVGISGSTKIGANCLLGGSSGYAGHISICDNVQITGMGMVTGNITTPGTYSSGTGLLPGKQWRKAAVRFRQLDELNQKVRQLEKQLAQKTRGSE